MKNLKRVLSLALTGVMLVGMMAIGASAANKDFTDADEIQHTEAVNVMSTLGVLKGKDTGAFDPAATVTRAEMAKIICVMLNGGNDPTLGTAGANMFSDTASHWAKSYIEYCASMGIIAGMGDGTFGPDLPVTGAAAAKMLLVALGYDSDISGFTGVDWEINVNRQANEAKLYEEIKSIDTSAGLSRDNTAQMAYNALEAKLMVREDNKVVSSGEISYTYKKGSQSFLNKYFDASVFIGTFEGNNATGASGTAKGEILIRGNLDTENTEAGTTGYVAPKAARIPSDLAISFIGEEFKVIFKDTRGGIMGQPDKNDTIYGIFNTGAVTVYNITKADLQDAGSTNVGRGKIKFNDTVYDVAGAEDDFDVIVKNYGNGTTVTGDTISSGSGADATKAEIADYINDPAKGGLRVNSSDPIKFVTNASGEIVRAYVENWTYSSVLSMTSNKIQLEGVGSKDLEDVAMLDDEIKVDDIVAVADFYPAGTTKTQVKKASTLRGVIEAIDGAKLRIDGTWYKKSVNAEGLSDYSDTQTYDVGDEYELVLDGEKFYVAGKTISAEVNYALALKSETGLTERVRLLLADGTEQTYIINSDSTMKNAQIGSTLADGSAKLVKYELVKNGTEVKMTEADKITTGTPTWNKDTKVVNISGTKTTSDTAVAFVFNTTTNKWRVINASNMGSITAAAATTAAPAYYAMKSGKVVAFTLQGTAFPTGVADSSNYGYVTGKIVTKNGDDTVTELTIWDGTEDVKVLVDGRTSSKVAGDFVKFPVSNAPVADSEIVKTGDGLNWETVKVKEYDTNRNLVITTTGTYSVTGTLVGDTESVYKMDKDSKIIGVNTADKKSASNNAITPYTKISGSDYNNAFIISETDPSSGTKTVKAIFVDVDNKLGGDSATGAAGSSYTVAAATTSTGSSAPVAALNNAYIGVATDKTSAIQGEKVTYTVTVYGNVGSTAGQVVAPSGVTLDSVEGDGVTKDTNTAKIAANKGNGAVLKFSQTVATSNVAAVDFVLAAQGGSPTPPAASTTPVAAAKDNTTTVALSGGSASLEVVVTTPSDTSTVTYSWANTGAGATDLSSTTTATASVSAAGTYTCTVTNTESGKSPATCTVTFTVTA